MRPQRGRAQPMGQVQVVRGGERRLDAAHAGGVHPRAVPEHGTAVRLVEGAEVPDPVAEPAGDHAGVLREPQGRVARQPAAAVLQALRQVPVVERHQRIDAALEQAVDEPVVEVQPGLVHRAASGRYDAWPGDGEAVRRDAQRAEQVEVVLQRW